MLLQRTLPTIQAEPTLPPPPLDVGHEDKSCFRLHSRVSRSSAFSPIMLSLAATKDPEHGHLFR